MGREERVWWVFPLCRDEVCGQLTVHTPSLLQDWRSLYILHHNWHTGQCRITYLDVASPSPSPPPSTITARPPLVAFRENLLLTAPSSGTAVHAWCIADQRSVGTLTSDGPITALALDRTDDQFTVGVGTAQGGFAVWTCGSAPTEQFSPVERIVRSGTGSGTAIVAIAVLGPMIVTCSAAFELAVHVLARTDGAWGCETLHRLRSDVSWTPVDARPGRVQSDQIQGGVAPGSNAQLAGLALAPLALHPVSGVGVSRGSENITSPLHSRPWVPVWCAVTGSNAKRTIGRGGVHLVATSYPIMTRRKNPSDNSVQGLNPSNKPVTIPPTPPSASASTPTAIRHHRPKRPRTRYTDKQVSNLLVGEIEEGRFGEHAWRRHIPDVARSDGRGFLQRAGMEEAVEDGFGEGALDLMGWKGQG
ncbi:hypothetical protein BDK51DRAFT_52583 [Blyttiomyces helicus]|uniref:Uncharacterized protein n=1 Tax=Blyttiomyces helicus TaxID=388810 RepID=A0A4P9VUD1_9FUNG|nr:hypothetical protein BDK51DRAFT_52583 [Blyttiomyces helicus]|eukprot:RKO83194.1 hypothetical protein BDK51DRAFT_52583 [Blyttiomyces helicus]